METISSYLETLHKRCDAQFADTVTFVAARNWPQADVVFAQFREALERHFDMEEQVVFAAFEQAVSIDIGPTNGLRREHLHMRGMLQRLDDSIRQRDTTSFGDHADTLCIILRQHGEKEEGILYPMVDRLLARRVDQLIADMDRIAADARTGSDR